MEQQCEASTYIYVGEWDLCVGGSIWIDAYFTFFTMACSSTLILSSLLTGPKRADCFPFPFVYLFSQAPRRAPAASPAWSRPPWTCAVWPSAAPAAGPAAPPPTRRR